MNIKRVFLDPGDNRYIGGDCFLCCKFIEEGYGDEYFTDAHYYCVKAAGGQRAVEKFLGNCPPHCDRLSDEVL